jgi:hypothetical protein
MGFCTALVNEILDQVFGGSDYAEPATWYLGLATGVAADGTITGEPSGYDYARVAITNDKTTWSDAASGVVSNDIDFTFPAANGGSWGALDTVFLSTTSSGGTALLFAEFTEKTIADGDAPYVATGDMDISIT